MQQKLRALTYTLSSKRIAVGGGGVVRLNRDGRRQIVSITATGRAKVDDTVPQIAGPIERAFSDLAPDELALLGHLLGKAITSLDKGAHAIGDTA